MFTIIVLPVQTVKQDKLFISPANSSLTGTLVTIRDSSQLYSSLNCLAMIPHPLPLGFA